VSSVAAHKKAAEIAFKAHLRSGSTEKLKHDFPAAWKAFKHHFAEAQHGKCGYCESYVTSNNPGDLEHYHPKGEIWCFKKLSKKLSANNSAKRQRPIISLIGYWYLAYEWSNYLFACSHCNQKFKGSFFPIRDAARVLPPTKKNAEVALLLNPYCETNDPADHLEFDKVGQISARSASEHGYETIRTCGLDRDELVTSRSEKAIRIYNLLSEVMNPDLTSSVRKIMLQIWEMGNSRYVHSGMIRAVVKQNLFLSWDELSNALGQRPN
jgi:hypothetical protein